MEEAVLMRFQFLAHIPPSKQRLQREKMSFYFNPCSKRVIQQYTITNWNKSHEYNVESEKGKQPNCTGLLLAVRIKM